MSAEALAALLLKITQVAPGVINDVQALLPIAKSVIDHVKSGNDPTPDEWAVLHAKIDSLTADIEAPIP